MSWSQTGSIAVRCRPSFCAPPQGDSNAYLEAKQLLIDRIASERGVAPHVRRRCFRSLLGHPTRGTAAQQLALLLCEKKPSQVGDGNGLDRPGRAGAGRRCWSIVMGLELVHGCRWRRC